MTTQYFDRFGQPVQTIDPLGRCSAQVYDSHRRLWKAYSPENYTAYCAAWTGNGISTAYTYDVRHNVLTETQHPKVRRWRLW